VSTVQQTVTRAREEFVSSPRLRLGVWLIVTILLGYLVFDVQSTRLDAVVANYAAAQARLVRAKDLLAREDWPELLATARAAERDLAPSFWQAENLGLAQAGLRATLEQLAKGARIARPRVEIGLSMPVPEAPGLWRIQAEVVGSGPHGSELRLLHAIATHPQKLVEERNDLTRRTADTTLNILVSAYFVLHGEVVEPSPSGAIDAEDAAIDRLIDTAVGLP